MKKIIDINTLKGLNKKIGDYTGVSDYIERGIINNAYKNPKDFFKKVGEEDWYCSGLSETVDTYYGFFDKASKNPNEKFTLLIIGDHDNDGVRSTRILMRFFAYLIETTGTNNLTPYFFTPKRKKHGYGASVPVIEDCLVEHPNWFDGVEPRNTLVTLVDNGILAFEAIDYMTTKLGWYVNIIDHHEPMTDEIGLQIYPSPKNNSNVLSTLDCKIVSPFNGETLDRSAAVLCAMVVHEYRGDGYEGEYLDINDAATTVASDVTSMLDPLNRSLVGRMVENFKKGKMSNADKLILLEKGFYVFDWDATNRKYNTESAFFNEEKLSSLNATINAGCRWADDVPDKIVGLLVNEYAYSPKRKAFLFNKFPEISPKELTEIKSKKNEAVKLASSKIKEMIDRRELKNINILYIPNTNEGILSELATRLQATYTKAFIVCTDADGDANGIKASARSTEAFNITEFLRGDEFAPYIKKVGGHKAAAGVTFNKETFEKCVSLLETEAEKRPSVSMEEGYHIDLGDNPSFFELMTQQRKYGYFGKDLPKPLLLGHFDVKEVTTMKEIYLKISTMQGVDIVVFDENAIEEWKFLESIGKVEKIHAIIELNDTRFNNKNGVGAQAKHFVL